MNESLSGNRQKAARIIRCYQEFEFSVLPEIVAPDCCWEFPGRPEVLPWSGRYCGEEIHDFFAVIEDTLEFEYFKADRYLDAGETIAVFCSERFRVKSTGRWAENRLVGFFEFQEGMLVRYHEYADTAAMEAGFRSQVA